MNKKVIHILVGLLMISVEVFAIPSTITFQGRLLDSEGSPITNLSEIEFSLYDAERGGNKIFDEIHMVEPDQSGFFTVPLGTGVPLVHQLFEEPLWVQTRIVIRRPGQFPIAEPFSPPQPLTAAPYALISDNAKKLEGKTAQEITDEPVNIVIPDPFELEPERNPQYIYGNLLVDHKLMVGDVQPSPFVAAIRCAGNQWGLYAENKTLWRGTPQERKGIFAAGQKTGGAFYADGTAGVGVYAATTNAEEQADHIGGEFISATSQGIGVYGIAEKTETAHYTYGGKFHSLGQSGCGVSGESHNYGGKFIAKGQKGYGIYAESTADASIGVFGMASNHDPVAFNDIISYGGKFISAGRYGRGVVGVTTNTNSMEKVYGGFFTSQGQKGVGVIGKATNTSDGATNYGGIFRAYGVRSATGVYGKAENSETDKATSGGSFTSHGLRAIGVYGEASNTTTDGVTYGGKFTCNGRNGYGLFGIASGAAGIGVIGEATNNGLGLKYGGKFINTSTFLESSFPYDADLVNRGTVVVGVADSTHADAANFGARFIARGGFGIGVYGETIYDEGVAARDIMDEIKAGESYGVFGKATGANGIGIFARTANPDGYAAKFIGGRGLTIPSVTEPANDGSVASPGTISYNPSDQYIYVHTGERRQRAMLSQGHATDLAENFSSKDKTLEAGDVVVADSEKEKIVKSQKPYDTSIAGVISTEPEQTMGTAVKDGKPVALVGRVPCKVTNENGPIKIGDLLSTSSTPGHAMRANEAKIGAIIGKALESFSGDKGKIVVLLMVQ